MNNEDEPGVSMRPVKRRGPNALKGQTTLLKNYLSKEINYTEYLELEHNQKIEMQLALPWISLRGPPFHLCPKSLLKLPL